VIVPRENAAEAAVVDGVRVFGVQHLSEVVALLKSPEQFTPVSPPPAELRAQYDPSLDFGDATPW
jgi:magnesium chelatase family protein